MVVVVEKWAVVMRVMNGVITAMVDEHDCMSHSGIILSWTQYSSVHPGTPRPLLTPRASFGRPCSNERCAQRCCARKDSHVATPLGDRLMLTVRIIHSTFCSLTLRVDAIPMRH